MKRSAAATASEREVGMKITKVEDGFVVMSDGNMTGRRLYESSGCAIIHMTVQPGREVAPHAAAVDMEFYVLEGRGRFMVGDESREAGPGSLVESPRNISHGIVNTGSGPLRLLAIKNNRPSDGL